MRQSVCAIILAAGSGSRMQLPVTKQRLNILGESVLHRSVRAFDESSDIEYIVVVCHPDEVEFAKGELCDIKKLVCITPGGKTRAESARIGFFKVPEDAEFVAIHDAARCFCTRDIIYKVVSDAKKYGAATASHLVTDTVKRVDEDGFIVATENRDMLRTVQTPQVFKCSVYKQALLSDVAMSATDDNMLVEAIGQRIFCTETGSRNIKVTFAEDIKILEFYLRGEENEL